MTGPFEGGLTGSIMNDKNILRPQTQIQLDEGKVIEDSIAQRLQRAYGENHKLSRANIELEGDLANIASLIHYPNCWDTVAYPTLYDAIAETLDGCTICRQKKGLTNE